MTMTAKNAPLFESEFYYVDSYVPEVPVEYNGISYPTLYALYNRHTGIMEYASMYYPDIMNMAWAATRAMEEKPWEQPPRPFDLSAFTLPGGSGDPN